MIGPIGTQLATINLHAHSFECQFNDMKNSIQSCERWLDETNVVLIDEEVFFQAQDFVRGCENCNESALMSFDYLLDAVTQCDPTMTEYAMCHTARCPHCHADITEKTLVLV